MHPRTTGGSIPPAMMPKAFRTVDVRKLLDAGREPFPLIRAAVTKLRAAEGLEIIAPFIPAPLIEFLECEGFEKSIERNPDGTWITRFWRRESIP